MRELEEFYGFKWSFNRPKIVQVPDRNTIDQLWQKKSESWQIGWVNGQFIFVLDNEKMEKESSHKKHSKSEYYALVKHELGHAFFRIMSKGGHGPKWLWEGVAIYSSGQHKIWNKGSRITYFEKFLDNDPHNGLYQEAGWVIATLLDKFGKQKLFDLIKDLPKSEDYKKFEKHFKKVYGFLPRYKELNKIAKAKNK